MTRRTRTPPPLTPPGGITHHRDSIFDSQGPDPYQAKGKYAEPTACPDCGLIFHRGLWQRGTAPPDAHAAACPACRRTADARPAGFVHITGPFVSEHRAEVLGLVRNEADRENAEHPLHRVMAIEEAEDEIVVTTTDLHLPRRIGEALERAYGGRLEVQHAKGEHTVRAYWSR